MSLSRALISAAVIAAVAGCGAEPEPRPGAAERRAVVWAVGDGADATLAGRQVADRIAAGRVDRFLYLGDVYPRGRRRDFANHYAPTYGRLAEKTAPTPGNHEWGRRKRGYDPYWRSVHGRAPKRWYAFEAAGWTVLSLNSQAWHGRRSTQLRWLRRQVAAPGTCRIAFWHRPRFSAGARHGNQPDMAPLWNALRGRAAIAIAGHEHGMQRFVPIDGITQFVSGAGGRENHAIDEDDERLAFADDETLGALRLRLRPGRANHAFISADGRVLDRGTVRCDT